tara:strand:- start:363 stop:956 length:594 start_codon:yes stop_codon:yes gene_type:complete
MAMLESVLAVPILVPSTHIVETRECRLRAPYITKLLTGGFVSMNRFDTTPYRRSTVGFDRLFDLMERQARNAGGDNYPPFNIERRDEDAYRIALAVAGFRAEDLEITAQQNLLVIQGRKRDDQPEGEMLHIGIANRGFERRFDLADYVRVENADLRDGMLYIDLVREVPDAMKPKKIAIGGQKTLEVVKNEDDSEAA